MEAHNDFTHASGLPAAHLVVERHAFIPESRTGRQASMRTCGERLVNQLPMPCLRSAGKIPDLLSAERSFWFWLQYHSTGACQPAPLSNPGFGSGFGSGPRLSSGYRRARHERDCRYLHWVDQSIIRKFPRNDTAFPRYREKGGRC